MTQPTNTYDSYDLKGNREDLSDMIFDISPMDTPFFTAAKKGKATATLHEWQTDALDAAAANAQVEGDDYSADAGVATSRLGNYSQIMAKAVTVTGTADIISKAGRKKELAYQVAKRSRELKRDIEFNLCGVNNARAVGNSTTARELASVQSWIATNTSAGAGGSDPTGDGTDARTDGTQRAFTEDLLLDVWQSCWDEGGNPNMLGVGSFNKRVASTFTGNSTRFDKGEDKRVTGSVDVYISDFGEARIVANRFQRSRDALLIDSDYWKIAFLRNFTQTPLAKTGDAEKRLILTELTLEACNEKSSGIIADLTVS